MFSPWAGESPAERGSKMLVIVEDGSSLEIEWAGSAAALVAANDGDEAVAEAVAEIEAGATSAYVGFSRVRRLKADNGKAGDARVFLDQEDDGTFVLRTNGNPVGLHEGDDAFVTLMDAEAMRGDVERVLAVLVANGDEDAREAAGWALDKIEAE